MTIKKCTLEDIETLQKVCRETFVETFSDQNTAEDMEKYLNEIYALDVLEKEIANVNSVTFIAYDDSSSALGYLKLNRADAQTEKGFDDFMEIQRIYILKKAKGQGIGSEFIRISETQAKEWGLSHIWLGVWEHNYPAQDFYKKKGFVRFSEHVFVLGNDVQTDFLMKKDI